jgi:hypothetical protein
MKFVYSDGGRSAAGFKGSAGDCVCRAISIATGRSYAEVYGELNAEARRERRGKRKGRGAKSSARNGVHKATTARYLAALGWKWTPTMGIGTGCRVHLRADELPGGRLIVSLSRHLAAVVDGAIYDTEDPTRGGSRCVYGYWTAGAA